MIKTGKKDIVISYLSYFMRLTTNIFLLPLILRKMPSAEYGLWNIFLSVGAFVNLIDMGFSVVIVRYVTYAFCGAKDIQETGIPKLQKNGDPNYALLFRIYFAGKNVYKRLFIISLFIVFILSAYIIYVGKEVNILKMIISWGIYGISVCFYIYYIAYSCVIKGLGKLKENHIFYIIQQVVYICIAVILLALNWGILAMAIANFLATFLFRLLNIHFIHKLFKPEEELLLQIKAEKKESINNIYRAIKNNTKGLSLVAISNYVLSYGGTLICSIFLSLEQIASFGLTNQLIGIISSIAITPFSIFMPKLNDLQLNNQFETLKDYYAGMSVFMLVTYIVGGLGLGITGNRILQFFGTNTVLLSRIWIAIMLISNYILNYHQRCTNFIMLSNRQPHIKAYCISSLVTLFLAIMGLSVTRNIGGYILPTLLVQLSYNAWKWPLELQRQIKIKKFEIWKRTCQILKNTLIKGCNDKC